MNLKALLKVIVSLVFTLIWLKISVEYGTLIRKPLEPINLVSFNKSTDLIVFLHIEKTGGTNFEDKIVNSLVIKSKETNDFEFACEKRSEHYHYCPRNFNLKSNNTIKNNWFISRKTVGWYCGVHADYAKMKACISREKKLYSFIKKIHFITILRDPTARYVSEWEHVLRSKDKGYFYVSAFYESQNACNQEVSIANCVPNITLKQDLSLEAFTQCENNIAENRQTRLLADYDENGKNCSLFNHENRRELIKNAKNTLRKMSYFAINEYEELSQKLFEKTFQNSFQVYVKVLPDKYKTHNFNLIKSVNKSLIERIDKLNDLDWELYEFAKILFFERIKFYNLN